MLRLKLTHGSKRGPWSDANTHYNDVIMSPMASQLTSLTIVSSTVYSYADQRKQQSSASLAFVWGIHRDRWIPRTTGQLRGKCFHLMTSSWDRYSACGVIAIYNIIVVMSYPCHDVTNHRHKDCLTTCKQHNKKNSSNLASSGESTGGDVMAS